MAARKKKSSSLFNNLGLKLTSLILALLLEVYFYSPDNSVTELIPVTIELRNLPSETMITEPERAEKGIPAQIEVRGPRPLVEQVRTGYNKIPIFLPTKLPSTHTERVDDDIQLPAGVELLNVRPPDLTIRSERVVRKELLIVVDKLGKPSPGYQIESLNLFPDTVVVRGPEKVLGDVRAIEAEPVNVEGITKSVRKELSLRVPGPLVSLGVDVATVDIKVSPILQERRLENLRVRAPAPSGYMTSVEPTHVDALIRGPENTLNQLRPEDVALSAGSASLEPGEHSVVLKATLLPEGVELVKTEPEKVTVRMVKTNE